MKKFTIDVEPTPESSSGFSFGPVRAIIRENVTADDDCDQEGCAFFTGRDEAACLGSAMFYLSTIEDLEDGVKLDITNRM